MKVSPLSCAAWIVACLFTPNFLTALSASPKLDHGLTIIQTFQPQVRPGFGHLLPSEGEVRVVINVDDKGKLVDWLPVSYTHPDYYKAAEEALKGWQYQPAKQDGAAIGIRKEVVFNFESRGQVVSLSGIEAVNSLLEAAGHRSEVKCLYRGQELDTPPTLVKGVQPLWVPAMEHLAASSGVLIDFYIDETGHPRMPTASEYADPTLALTAVHALEQWEFSAPLYRGRPVIAHAAQRFSFHPQKAIQVN